MIVTSIAKTIALLTLTLFVWRALYPTTDWAALGLAPLVWLLFRGTYYPAIMTRRAIMEVAIIPGSALSGLFTGRAITVVFSAAFTLVAVPVLAWQALTASAVEIVALLLLCMLASALSLWAQTRLAVCLRPPFARSIGMGLGYVVIGLVFVLVLAWINWNFVSHPGYIRSYGLAKAVLTAINELPERGGVIAGALSVFYALDAVKIWCAVRVGNSFWVMALYCLDAALVAFIVAKSSVAIADCRGVISNNQQ